jgi:hypothetical protein
MEAISDTEETEALKWPVPEKRIGRLDREELLQMASDLIEYLHARACGPRFRPYPTDKDRAAFQRVMVAAMSAYGSILRDEEIENIKRRLEALEHAKGTDKGTEDVI